MEGVAGFLVETEEMRVSSAATNRTRERCIPNEALHHDITSELGNLEAFDIATVKCYMVSLTLVGLVRDDLNLSIGIFNLLSRKDIVKEG